MLKSFQLSAVLLLGIALAAPANAFCSYNGVDYAHTTISQEFRDSRWVVRARVISAFDGQFDGGDPDGGMLFTVYRLEVIRAYKGRPPQRIRFFTERNSGGFYMDRPWVPLPAAHDVGGEYLLFLIPNEPYRGRSAAARNSVFVNYSCGLSGRWRDVPAAARRELAALARRH